MAEETQDSGAERQPQGGPEGAEAPPEGEAQETLPRSTVYTEDAGTLRKKVTVSVPRARIDAKFDEMFGELSESVQVPGFRIGHAPRRLIEKRYGKEVSEDVRNALIGEALRDATEQPDLKTLGEPDIDLDRIELPDRGDMEFSFEVEVAPEFELPELTGIPITDQPARVTDEQLDEQLDQIRRSRASFRQTDEPAQRDDVVVCSATLTIEGAEPVQKPGLNLRVAPGQIEGLPLVDLPDALQGKKAGQTAELTVTVPEAHANEAWRGKEARIRIDISSVRRAELPELNDAFAQSLGFDSLEDLREVSRQRLEQQAAMERQRSLRQQVCDYLLEHTELDVPEGVAKRHTDSTLQRQYVELLQMGIPREKIDERMAELQSAAAQRAQRDIKLQFVLGKIAEEKSIGVTEGEVNSRIAQIAQYSGRRPERLRQELDADGSLEQVGASLREGKVLDMLLNDAEISAEASGASSEGQTGGSDAETDADSDAPKE